MKPSEKWVIYKRVKDILKAYLFDEDEKRAVIHLEFEKLNGERQEKTLWFVRDGFKKDGTPGSDEMEFVDGADLVRMQFFPSFLDNPDRTMSK